MIVTIAKKYLPYNLRIKLRKIIFSLRYLYQLIKTKFRDEKVYCPITRKCYRQFLKHGKDLLTPKNGAWGRHRLLWLYLNNCTDLFKSTEKIKLLHPAPELCFYEIFKKNKNIEYYPVDLIEKGLIKIDLTNIQYPDNYFDFIICNHVLEHINNDIQAIKELYRVLKPGGTAIIMVPINEKFEKTYENNLITTPEERLKHFGHKEHVRWYGMDIKDRFQDVGFKVRMLKYSIIFTNEEIIKYGLNNDYIIHLLKLKTL